MTIKGKMRKVYPRETGMRTPRPNIKIAEDWTSEKVNVEKLMAKDWNSYVAYKYWEGSKNIW